MKIDRVIARGRSPKNVFRKKRVYSLVQCIDTCIRIAGVIFCSLMRFNSGRTIFTIIRFSKKRITSFETFCVKFVPIIFRNGVTIDLFGLIIPLNLWHARATCPFCSLLRFDASIQAILVRSRSHGRAQISSNHGNLRKK